ncbi:MAG TPA: alpha-amylase family glycosyl hydrolase [Kiritimatiellia bacterium]|nr:alpha-amylase family glycosyl hydrolase [Kiritimatiellia bacterium]HPS06578.1 alpha-amylase family glycosyl hydrolase [Kiritimatiellia bacterium]
MRFFWVMGWIAGIVLEAQPLEVPLHDTPQGKIFGTERFAVRLDGQTGWAGEVLCDGHAVVRPAEVRQVFDILQDKTWVTGGGLKIEGRGVERVAPDTVRSRMRAGEWSVDACLQLFPEQRMLRRWFEITWHGAAATKIKGFWFQGGVLPLGEKGSYFIPAHYPPLRVGVKELTVNRKTGNWRSPYPVIGETGNGWSAVWMSDELVDYGDRGSSGVQEELGQIRVTQSFNTLGHVRQGVPQKVGDAWLWLQPNDAETALRRMGEWFRFVKQVPPEGRPDWLQRVILYSFHPGGTIGSDCRDLGGFKAATEFLPHIRGLGCNAIWLMPLEDKSIYSPRDYYAFQEGLGAPEDYRALTARAHGLGMRVWQDCVPHGGCNHYPRAKEHPEWLAQNEDGSTLSYWCFDFNWPTWLDYMSNVVSFYTREYALDGFRIDAVSGSKIPNWNPDIPYARASHAQAQGGLAMQRALRRAVKAVRPDGANLAEAGESIHGAVSDSTYDFSLCYSVLHEFRKSPANVFVPRLQRWLHEQQYAEIPDLVRMRHVESHDSLRSGLWYGADAQRSLVALIAWIHGIPMVYHEMEDGNYEAYRTIFHVRNRVAELNGGAADYLGVSAPEGVFACLRTGRLPAEDGAAWHGDYAWDTRPKGADRASVVLVNMNGYTVSGRVAVPPEALPAALRSAGWARDLMSGERVAFRDGVAHIALPAFGYTVLRFGSKALPELVARDARGADVKLPPRVASLKLKSGSGTLQIDPATGLATVWQSGRRTLAAGMDLVLPEALARLTPEVTCRQTGDAVEVTRRAGTHTLTVRYMTSDDGIAVRAAWQGGVPQGAAVAFDLPVAERWLANTAEGLFESPFRVRHPQFDGKVGPIYRLPQGTSVVWDSRLHPFGLSARSAWVGASVAGVVSAFSFDPARLPAAVQVLDRVGAECGMKVLMTWRDDEPGVAAGGDELVFHLGAMDETAVRPRTGLGDARLAAAGGGWTFENAHYRARISRTGALAELWRRQDGTWRQVAGMGSLYTDRGFSAENERYAQENDVEAYVRIERSGAGVRFAFSGEMRGFQRFDKMWAPVRFYSAYTFDDGPSFRQTMAFSPTVAPSGGGAYLAYLQRVEGATRVTFADAAGDFLSGMRGDGKVRYAQTGASTEPQRMPNVVRIEGTNGVLVRLSDAVWFGAKPANLFMHGGDLHLAWLDGKAGSGGVGFWNGVSLSVSCGAEEVAARDEALPLARREPESLLRDGDFEQNECASRVLARSGLPLPTPGKSRSAAWHFPNGAEAVSEGGSRCVTVEGDGKEYRLVRQALPVTSFPVSSTWRLTARMKGAGVEKADVGWKSACLRWSVAAPGRNDYQTVSLPFGDSAWREYSVEMTVPDGVREVCAEAGLNGNRGRVWIDDVRVEKITK